MKLEEFNYNIEYKKGNQNYVADCLSRISPTFNIEYKNSNIFESKNPIIHCISKDFEMSQGFAKQINEHYHTKNNQKKIKIISDKLIIR